MPYTIDQEAAIRELQAIDVNYAGDRYKTNNEIFVFPSPVLELYEQHLFYLLKNSEVKDLDRKYIMRPDYLSYDEYKTVNLAHLLMFVNSIRCIEDFNLLKVVVPTFQAVIEILKDKFSQKEIEDLLEVNW
jgi:hypothetical protein